MSAVTGTKGLLNDTRAVQANLTSALRQRLPAHIR